MGAIKQFSLAAMRNNKLKEIADEAKNLVLSHARKDKSKGEKFITLIGIGNFTQVNTITNMKR